MPDTRRLARAASVAALVGLGIVGAPSAWAQRGDPTTCDGTPSRPKKFKADKIDVRYYHATVDEPDYKCDPGDPLPCDVSLRGWLYLKKGADVAGEKAIIFDHGHDKERGEPCDLVNEFVGRGYVLFAPLRRGHVAKDGSLRSTGVHIDDYVAATCGPACDGLDCSVDECAVEREREGLTRTDYLDEQVFDVREQIAWLAQQASYYADGSRGTGKLVDPDRISLLGHSFGGSLVLIANAADPEVGSTAEPPVRFQSVVSVSPAELEWDDSTAWKTRLGSAMANAHEPTYILQPKNAGSLEPSRILGAIGIGALHRGQVGIFPNAAATDADGDGLVKASDIHANFMKAASLADWAPSVNEFVRLYFRN